MDPKISVLLPSLNVASYIRECLESVVTQTFKDMEIICVDAGSDDGTLGVLEEYAGKDGRIRILKSPRRSYGLQVNMGLDAAAGEYVGIVDTDDFIRENMYEVLYGYAKSHDADFVKSDFEVFVHADNGERIYMPYPVTWACSARYGKCFTKTDLAYSMQTPDVFLWNGIYKREFLLENDIRFNETDGAAIQDCGVRYKIDLCLNKGYYLKQSLYCYRRDNAGASSYSSDILLYHLNEFQSIMGFAEAKGNLLEEQWSFLAREMAIISFRTYQDMLVWGKPSEGTFEAMERIRDIVRHMEKRGALSAAFMTPNAILEARLFLDDPRLCDGFARTRAKAILEGLHSFLDRVSSKEKVWIFGSKRVADYAYLFLRNNGVGNIAGFFDNDKKRQGGRKFNLPIVCPEEMAEKEKNAYFLIASTGYIDEIENWLNGHGFSRKQYEVYGGAFEQLLHPFICTNILIKEAT